MGVDEERLIECSCGERFSVPALPTHRLACVPLHNELRRRKRLLARPDWMSDARCKDSDTEDFFVDEAAYLTTPILKAKRICARCPLKRDCVEYAYSSPYSEEQGIYGGTTGRERQAAKEEPDRIDYLMAQVDEQVKSYRLVMRVESEDVA